MVYKAPLKILFVCSKNQWRSPTAEAVYRSDPRVSVRSAGTQKSSRKRLSENDILWADLILVMEDKHKARLRSDHRRAAGQTRMIVLDIADDYPFMDPELIEILKLKIDPILAQPSLA